MKKLLVVLAVCSVVGTATTERSSCLKRVAFSSTNFENILTWETEADIPPGTVFDVQYKQYGEKAWLNKRECQSITQPFCNLTHETENFTEHYYARVRAVSRRCSSNWVCSERFEPRKETIIGAPEVEYIPHVRSIRFLIHPPYTPLRGEDGHQLNIEDIYSKFSAVDYHLTLFNQRTHQKWIKNEHNKEFEVSNLDPDTEYNGTVHLYLLERSSKRQVFWVKTLPDNTWLFYCFVALGFCAGLVFAAIGYVTYKYVKQHGAQPMSLDFRGISSFQPLTLTVEHIIKPINLSKPSLLTPEAQFPQVGRCLDKPLEPPQPFHPSSGTYQQQANLSVFHGVHLLCSVSAAPAGYAPQTSEKSTANLPTTYGVCVDGTDHSNKNNFCPNQLPKEDLSDSSAGGKLISHMLGESSSHWNYKEQQPNVAPWASSAMRDSALVHGSPQQTQQLLLWNDGVESEDHLPQLLLPSMEQGGCYRQQAVKLPLLLSSVTADTDCVPEDECLSRPSAAPLLSVSTRNNLPGENTKWWESPHSVSHSENKVQFQETWEAEETPAAQELNCKELGSVVSPDTISEYSSGISFSTLFKDLNLKLLWDQADENTAFY
ncbi:interleukin-22 receptor subunit alpha-1 isoform X1 [Coturnix japonica]|uniref:Interleukin-22 receptor subunit alpha-1 n=1 Tax=Coturnix japonica TaxID=93934 RepID=A0A8C2SXN8_COTJA|nr:interleukin-22 receptor subunit alpha-1 isoform X1 [Coturnix japonica]